MTGIFSGKTFNGLGKYEGITISFSSDTPLKATWSGDTIAGHAMDTVQLTGSFIDNDESHDRRLFQLQGQGSVTLDDGTRYDAMISVCGFQELDPRTKDPKNPVMYESWAQDGSGRSESVGSRGAGGFTPA